MTAYTPGPWQVIDRHVYGANARLAPFTGPDGVYHKDHVDGIVAIVYDGASTVDGANARLIAAAPELLEALQAIHDEADHAIGTEVERPLEIVRQNVETIRRLARAAIALTEKNP